MNVKKYLKSLWLLAVMLSMSVTVNAQTKVGDIFYWLDDYELTATVTYDPSTDIWSTVDTYKGDIEIPETFPYGGKTYTVKNIGGYAFQNCHNLTSIKLPKSITSISDDCGLTSCKKLKSITVDANNANYVSADNGVLYNKAKTQILCIPAKRGGKYTIPSTVTAINNCVGCPELDELIIPATVTTLGNNCFRSCYDGTKIKKLTIKDGTSQLTVGTGSSGEMFNDEDGNYQNSSALFYNCGIEEVYLGRDLKLTNKYSVPFACNDNLSKVVIGSKVTTIPNYSFVRGWNIQTVDVKGGLAQWLKFDLSAPYTNPFWAEGGAMGGSTTLLFNGAAIYGNVSIPDGITKIPAHAFQYGSANITSLNIPASVTDIEDGAFRGLAILQNVYLASGNTSFKVTDNVLYNMAATKIHLYPQLKPGDFTVPSTVTELGDYLFSGCSKLTGITIPASVMKLGSGLFSGCTALKTVTIQASNTALTSSASLDELPVETLYIGRNISSQMYNNTWEGEDKSPSLRSVTISNKVTAFPWGFFSGCYRIQSVYFEGTISEWCNISFANQTATPFGSLEASPILYLNGNPLHSQVNIPSGATKIGAYTFYGQKGVSRINVPSTVTTIEQNAFNSPYISDVIIAGSSVATLESTTAFNDNTSIYVSKSMLAAYRVAPNWSDFADRIFPDGFLTVTVNLTAMSTSPALLPALNALEEVDGEYRITALTSLKIKGTMNGYDILMIRTKMPNLRTLDLSEATIVDNDGGFEYYTGYHTALETITPYMFYGIKNLKTVILPANIKTIQNYAFAESGITSMIIPSTVKEIGYNSFQNCQDLIDLTLTKGLEIIQSNAFQQCQKLRALVLPTTLKRIEGNAFEWCYGLASIDFAEGLEYIGYGAFQGCYNLKELHMPTSLRRIDGYAFNGCRGLSEVHVPSMLTEIGDYAFKECGLKSVYAYTLVPVQINQNTFDYAGVKLFAPKSSFYTYYINTQWAQFPTLKEFDAKYTCWYTPRNTDVQINTTNPIPNLDDKNRAEGSLEPGSGLIFIGDGEQLVKDLILNWQHGSKYPALIEDGNLSVEELKFIMNVYPGRWYFFSFPFDIRISDTTFGGKYVWRYYDGATRAANGSGGWKNVTDGILHANQGYIFQANTEGDLELPIANPTFSKTDDKEVALQSYASTNAQDASWNFVGNPNLSYYDLQNLDNFNAPVTVWDNENQTYTAVMPGDDDYDFHPFEAYFVQTPTGTSEMTFESDKRETYVQTEGKAEARMEARRARRVNENRMLINLSISDGTSTDKTRVIFNDKNTMDYETGADASKFMSMAAVPQIYTLDRKNVKYAINARPNGNQEVRIGYVASAEGRYTIQADLLDCYMALKDNETGSIHMLDDGAYTFFTEAGTFENRFSLIPGSATGISSKSIDGYDISTEEGGIAVNGLQNETMSIYKLNGVKVASLNESGRVNLASGTYIVTIGGKSTKVLVK